MTDMVNLMIHDNSYCNYDIIIKTEMVHFNLTMVVAICNYQFELKLNVKTISPICIPIYVVWIIIIRLNWVVFKYFNRTLGASNKQIRPVQLTTVSINQLIEHSTARIRPCIGWKFNLQWWFYANCRIDCNDWGTRLQRYTN